MVHFSGWFRTWAKFYPFTVNWSRSSQTKTKQFTIIRSTNINYSKILKISSSQQALRSRPSPWIEYVIETPTAPRRGYFATELMENGSPRVPTVDISRKDWENPLPAFSILPQTPRFCCGMFSGANADGADGEGWIKAWLRPPGPFMNLGFLVYRHSRWSSSMFNVHKSLAIWNFWNLWNTWDLLLGSGEASILHRFGQGGRSLAAPSEQIRGKIVTVSISVVLKSIRRPVKLDHDVWGFRICGGRKLFLMICCCCENVFILSSTYKHIKSINKPNISTSIWHYLAFIQVLFLNHSTPAF